MTTKTVICLIEPRKKVIKFISKEGSSDYVALKQSFLEASEKDKLLKQALVGNAFIFQAMNAELEEWCDLEEEDVIIDKSKIKVVLIQGLNSLKVGESIYIPVENVNVNSIQEYLENDNESSSAQISDLAAQQTSSGETFDAITLTGECSKKPEKKMINSNLDDSEVR